MADRASSGIKQVRHIGTNRFRSLPSSRIVGSLLAAYSQEKLLAVGQLILPKINASDRLTG